ncbi:hypothetical protein LOK74_18985 [Brevibacillus humidisoli]|uniref:hypothetical protein n=1 Tax=Brevibacillus humidisoli TaxID=2895522 RepID=UPI001E4C62E3|nr:hypothetical protein [Brevibacillus humidisoli]UFJ40099.1 hypothetical protein LOK74_18985 [Brevibacillus humidisoli]
MFSKEVEAGGGTNGAENAANYSINGFNAGTITPTLLEDGKTVELALQNAISNNTTFAINVLPIALESDGSVKTEVFTKTITFSDTTKPQFKEVSYPAAGTARVYFTEELSVLGSVKVYDGSTLLSNGVDYNLTTFNAGENYLELTGLTSNKVYTVEVVGAKDQSGNFISPNPTSEDVNVLEEDTTPPEVVSVKAIDRDTLVIEFNEKLAGTTTFATVTVGGITADGAQSFDEDTNTLTVALGSAEPAGDSIESVVISGYSDPYNNSGDTYTKAVSFQADAPELLNTEVKVIGSDTFVVLTFNEDVDQAAAQGQDITGTYVTANNIVKNVDTAAINEGTDVTATDEVLKIKVTGFEAGAYNLTIPAAGISDGANAASDDLEISFTLEANDNASKPDVSAIYIPGDDASGDGGPANVPLNTIYVKYDAEMGPSAIDVSNYSIDGLNVFEDAVFVGDETLVKLTIADGELTTSGNREFVISSAVKGKNDVAIDEDSTTQGLNENVKPELVSAELVDGDTIRVTFSEVMRHNEIEVAAGSGDDFEVYVDGVKNAITAVASVAGSATDDNEFDLTLTNPITPDQVADDTLIELKLLDGSDAQDQATNPLAEDNITITVDKQ